MAQKWIQVKDIVSKMPLEEKRTFYKCEERFVQLSDIVTWPEYACKKWLPAPPPLAENEDERIIENPVLNGKISLWRGDITQLEVDAIVNAANRTLLGGGGVDGAIHRGAGRYLYDECDTLDGCDTGDAKITGGYKLPAKYVIHTVGPTDKSQADLEHCYKKSFTLMRENQLRSIAFPCIATGIYGYPNEAAAHVALSIARDFLEETNPDDIDRIIFTTFLEADVKIYEKLLQMYFPLTIPSDNKLGDSQSSGSPQKNSPQGSGSPQKNSPQGSGSPQKNSPQGSGSPQKEDSLEKQKSPQESPVLKESKPNDSPQPQESQESNANVSPQGAGDSPPKVEDSTKNAIYATD